jgi:hypothetical protein
MVVIMAAVGCNRSNNAVVVSAVASSVPSKLAKTPDELKAEEAAVVKAVESCLEAWEAEDLNKLSASLLPGSKEKADTIADAVSAFDTHDGLRYTLLTYEYVGDGIIKVVHGTSGDPLKFRAARADATWTFSQDSNDGDRWKLVTTTTPEIQFEDDIAKAQAKAKLEAEAKAAEAAKAVTPAVTAEVTPEAVKDADAVVEAVTAEANAGV